MSYVKINKKLCVILLVPFLLTGCTVDYELKINDGTMSEIVSFTESPNRIDNNVLYNGELTYKTAIENLYKIPQPVYKDADIDLYDEMNEVEGVEYYNKEMVSSNLEYGIKGHHIYNISEYKNARVINECYKNIAVLQNGSVTTLSTSRQFLCFEQYNNLEKVNVKITLDEQYEVITHNADTINDLEYVWTIDKSNYNDKSIVIEFKKKAKQIKIENSIPVLIGFIVIGCIIAMVIYLTAKRKNKKKNAI